MCKAKITQALLRQYEFMNKLPGCFSYYGSLFHRRKIKQKEKSSYCPYRGNAMEIGFSLAGISLVSDLPIRRSWRLWKSQNQMR